MFDQNDFQFYPTPRALGVRAWAKFKNRDFVRILEPSAGDGALIKAHPRYNTGLYNHLPPVDAIEMDMSKHDALRQCGAEVVGIDFMTFSNGAQYSHAILNPPFFYGVQHVLKAWDLLWDGEIVAIINAESLKNPFSKERQILVQLIKAHGEVEFIEDAFKGPDVGREADVEIALVYLKKKADLGADLFADFLDGLTADKETGAGLAGDFEQAYEVALPRSEVENRVAAFKAAVRAMKAAVFAEATASHYAGLLGKTMAERNDVKEEGSVHTLRTVKEMIGARYGALKDSAWAGILRGSNVTSRLSSKAQKRVESEFDRIKELEFSCQTIYGFLLGIVESQGQIQLDMACDVFDWISRYHSENAVWYKGYKSNDRHRTCGRRIKLTRFIIPRVQSYSSGLLFEGTQMLRDFDKVFAMLEGRTEPEISLEYLFSNHWGELLRGERVSGSQFDVRYYPAAGTIHFFPNKKKNLVDLLNRLVGRHRQWLPEADKGVSENFWIAYDRAEKMDAAVQKTVSKASTGCCSTFHSAFSRDIDEKARAEELIVGVIEGVLEANGISPHFLAIEHTDKQALLLFAA